MYQILARISRCLDGWDGYVVATAKIKKQVRMIQMIEFRVAMTSTYMHNETDS